MVNNKIILNNNKREINTKINNDIIVKRNKESIEEESKFINQKSN